MSLKLCIVQPGYWKGAQEKDRNVCLLLNKNLVPNKQANLLALKLSGWNDLYHISEIGAGFLLTKDFTARRILWHDVDHVLCGHDLVELDHVGVVEQLHHLDLAVDFLQVGLVQLTLVNDLDGNLENNRTKKKNQWKILEPIDKSKLKEPIFLLINVSMTFTLFYETT